MDYSNTIAPFSTHLRAVMADLYIVLVAIDFAGILQIFLIFRKNLDIQSNNSAVCVSR